MVLAAHQSQRRSVTRRHRQGSSLVTTFVVMAVLAIFVAALFSYAAASRRRSTQLSRAEVREKCAFSGLNYARAYFANNRPQWNAFLNNPQQYNPIAALTNPTPADPRSPALRAAVPQLFLDLDGDTRSDVYVFIRDNDDEFPPAVANMAVDNDQNVIVGAMCVSDTMLVRRDDGTPDPERVVVEALLSFDTKGSTYSAQSGAGSTGSGNFNSK